MLYSSLLNGLTTRRQALRSMFTMGGMAAAGGFGLAACADPVANGAQSTPQRRSSIDFDDPAQNLRAFVKVLGDLDPTVETFGWFGGDVFAVLDQNQPARKLFGVEGFGVLRCEPQPDGTYRLFNREIAFYKDPETREYMDVWTNPFTGEQVEVFPINNMTVNAELAPVMRMDFDGTMVETPFTPPWWFLRDNAFSMFEVHTAFPNPMSPEQWPRESAGPVIRISEIFHRTSKLAEIEDPDRSWADYTGAWIRIGPWMPWMLQGQAPGYLLYRTFMDRSGTVDNLPKPLVEITEQRFPEYFEAPGAETWGQPNDSSFSVYMRENEPQPLPDNNG